MNNWLSQIFILVLAAAVMPAQEYRATLLGTVTDPSGATVPEAAVTVRNTESGVSTTTKANGSGHYLVPFLLPGSYRLEVEHPGFKSFERSPITLRVNDRVRIDVALQVGVTSDRITISAETPLLEVANSSRGQVIEGLAITDLPVKSRNPFSLMSLAVGVQYTGSLLYYRPFDNGAIADFSINGGRSGYNEYQIDGISNNSNRGGSNLAYVPPVEATQEFKIQTNTYDAQYGRTGGGVVSVSVKSGTNSLHGAAYEYLRRTSLEANAFANNAKGVGRSEHSLDQYGFRLDGPVVLPKLYKGTNRTFFLFALEKYREVAPSPVLGTVPTELQHQGNFSETFNSSGQLYTVYDPLTIQPNPAFNPTKAVSLTNLQYKRTPFAGNIVPRSRHTPIAVNVLKDIPLPNQAGDPVTQANNWFAADAPVKEDYYNAIARIDHTLNDQWKLYGRWNRNRRSAIAPEGKLEWHTPAAGVVWSGRTNDGAVIDVAGILSPRTVLTARIGFSRYDEPAKAPYFDQTTLGISRSLISQIPLADRYPSFTWENYLATNNITGRLSWPSDTYTAQGGITRTAGAHSLKFGAEYRLLRWGMIPMNAPGNYAFTRSWTSSNPQVNDPAGGNSIASFLIGYMNSSSVTLSTTPIFSWAYPVLYFQDDWQVNRRLSLNLGLRWDYESPPVERFNRQNRGFDFDVASPYTIPGLELRGGLLFAGVDGQPRTAYNPDHNNMQPRVGLAYRVLESKPLVFRAGVGRYYLPVMDRTSEFGFSQATLSTVSTAEFLPQDVLSNPFPAGLIQPPGSSLGLKTQVGDAVNFADPNRTVPYVWQFSAGFQYELAPGTLVEASYVGSRTKEIQVSRSLNFLTKDQLALGTPYLSQAVANPFYGVLAPNTSRGATASIQRRELLMQYPHFTSVTMNNASLGESWYNSLQIKLEQRFKHGLSFLLSYTASKTMEAVSYLNAQDSTLTRELTPFDRPQRLVISGLYELPLGKQKSLLNQGVFAHILGGWQLSWTSVMQSGVPMSYPDFYLYGNPKLTNGQNLDRWFDTSKDIWVQRPADTLRTTPLRSPNIRVHSAPQVDLALMRSFRIFEGHELQFRASAFNATNTPIFQSPNTSPTSNLFGVVPITQINMPRSIDLGFRYVF